MADAKKQKRRAYLDSYQRDQDGKYAWHGDLYTFQGSGRQAPEKELRRELGKLWALCGIMMGALIAAGCITAPGMDNCFYVILPYGAGMVAGVSVCWALYRFTTGGNPLKSYVYSASVGALPHRTALAALCAALCIAGDILFVCRGGLEGKLLGFVLFLALNGLFAAASLLLRRRVLALRFTQDCVKK